MKCIYVLPHSLPVVIEIENTYQNIIRLLDADIFDYINMSDNVVMLCDDQGYQKPYQLPNCMYRNHQIMGPILITGIDEEDFCDLDETYIDAFLDSFYRLSLEDSTYQLDTTITHDYIQ